MTFRRGMILFGGLVAAIAATSCAPPPNATQAKAAGPEAGGAPGAVRVEVIRPERKTIRRLIEQPAQLRPYEETPVYAKVAGYLRGVNVDLGDLVRGPQFDAKGNEVSPGQVLLQVSIPELEDDVRQKAASVVQAQAHVEQSQAAILVAQAAVASAEATAVQRDAAVKRGEADCAKWRSEFNRISELSAKGAVTEKLVDETRNQLAAAEAGLEEAHAERKSADALIAESRAGLAKSQADLLAAQARLRVAEAEHAKAVTMVQYGTVRAPYDGVVTRRNAHTGHMVQPGPAGEPLLVVMRADVLRLQIDVPETDADLVRPGAPLAVRLPALGGDAVSGTIARTAGALDVSTRTLRVEADVPNRDGRLRPGLYAYATIVAAERKDGLVLPISAVLTDKGQEYCSCLDADQVVRKPVATGLRSKSEVEITSGLRSDEIVVRVNSASLIPGQRVDAIPYVPPK